MEGEKIMALRIRPTTTRPISHHPRQRAGATAMSARSSGALYIVGLDPARSVGWFPEASEVLAQADALIGYKPYTDRVRNAPAGALPDDNRVEISRAIHALELAQAGRKVAVVSGGDAGVFGMAAAVFELSKPATHSGAHWTSASSPASAP